MKRRPQCTQVSSKNTATNSFNSTLQKPDFYDLRPTKWSCSCAIQQESRKVRFVRYLARGLKQFSVYTGAIREGSRCLELETCAVQKTPTAKEVKAVRRLITVETTEEGDILTYRLGLSSPLLAFYR